MPVLLKSSIGSSHGSQESIDEELKSSPGYVYNPRPSLYNYFMNSRENVQSSGSEIHRNELVVPRNEPTIESEEPTTQNDDSYSQSDESSYQSDEDSSYQSGDESSSQS